MTPSAFTDLRKRAGTRESVARALGVTSRTLYNAETRDPWPRRVLLAYAIKGLLYDRAAGLPPVDEAATN